MTKERIDNYFDIAKKYGIFAALFIGLLVFVLNGYDQREKNLMDYLNKQAEINVKVASTLEKIDIRLQKLECK
jgi:hypothetical protein